MELLLLLLLLILTQFRHLTGIINEEPTMALFRWRIIQIKSDDVNCFKRTPLASTRKLLPPVCSDVIVRKKRKISPQAAKT